MNSKATIILSAAAVVFSLMALAPRAARAADVDEKIARIMERIKERTPEILKHKEPGLIGETAGAHVETVKPTSNEDVKKLIEAENADREKLLKLLAEKHGTDPQETRQNFAFFRFKQAKDNHYLKGLKGNWLTKKEWVEQAEGGGAGPFDK